MCFTAFLRGPHGSEAQCGRAPGHVFVVCMIPLKIFSPMDGAWGANTTQASLRLSHFRLFPPREGVPRHNLTSSVRRRGIRKAEICGQSGAAHLDRRFSWISPVIQSAASCLYQTSHPFPFFNQRPPTAQFLGGITPTPPPF